MPRFVSAILESPVVSLVARVLLTLMFWSSGIAKILDWKGGLGDMAHFNLNPPAAFNLATLVVQLVGSFLVIFVGRFAWLGAGMLAVFTALTIPIAHHFWTLTGHDATNEMYTAVEHVSIIGALILVSMLRWRETAER
jgi:transmembrane protein